MARIIKTTVYNFSELSEEAKKFAIKKYRDKQEFYWIYEDAHESIKVFNEIFDTKENYDDWLDISTSMINDNILLLSGVRLQTYIWNNYGAKLWKRKYLNHGELSENPKQYHRMRKQSQITSNCANKGLWRVSYYSNVQRDNYCVLTGVCYDNDLLWPIYRFMKTPQLNASTNFEDLIKECSESLRSSLKNEEEAMQTDDYIIEQIEANEYEFTEYGKLI